MAVAAVEWVLSAYGALEYDKDGDRGCGKALTVDQVPRSICLMDVWKNLVRPVQEGKMLVQCLTRSKTWPTAPEIVCIGVSTSINSLDSSD